MIYMAMMATQNMESILYILGVRIDRVNFSQALAKVKDFLTDGRRHLIVTPYAETIVSAQKDGEFRRILNESSLSVADGSSLLAAADFLSYKLPKRGLVRVPAALICGVVVGLKLLFFRQTFRLLQEPVRGVDLLNSLCRLAREDGLGVYLLGGQNGVSRRAAEVLKSTYPGLRIIAEDGPKRLNQANTQEITAILAGINQFKPAFLFVAFRPGEQEKWLARNMGKIEAQVFMAVGGAFDMVAGLRRRAPRLLRQMALEWLWRLLIEPARMGRIIKAAIVFPWLVFRFKLFENSSS